MCLQCVLPRLAGIEGAQKKTIPIPFSRATSYQSAVPPCSSDASHVASSTLTRFLCTRWTPSALELRSSIVAEEAAKTRTRMPVLAPPPR